jgi:hypothetical protein
MNRHFILVSILLLIALQQHINAQTGQPEFKEGMRLKLDSSGKKYIQFSTWATFWARELSFNPGTEINGITRKRMTDFSIRQFRFLTYSQLSPRYLILANIGMDNQTLSSGGTAGGGNTGNGGATFNGTLGKKPALYLHEFWNEYAVFPDRDPQTGAPRNASLYIGTGLHYWMGISRMTTASSSAYLALDVPLVNWPLVDLSDQYARQIGIYFKGNVDRIAYRWALNKPFTVLSSATVFSGSGKEINYAVDNNAPGKLATTGYAAWQFLEKESNFLPYTVGTYAGSKRVLNIGAGYYFTKDGTVTQSANSANAELIRHDIKLWSVDFFADLPFGGNRNWAFTGYTAFYHYDFGPNYLRNVSIMNENVTLEPKFSGPVSQAGPGNLAPGIGTGKTVFSQAGLLLPSNLMRKARLQPFAELSLQRFQRYGDELFSYWSAGGNIYLDGHHAKISVKYQTRPIVENDSQASSKGSLTVATQISL